MKNIDQFFIIESVIHFQNAEGYLFNTKLHEKPYWSIYLTSLHMGGGNLCSYSFTEFKFTDLPDKVTRCILLLFGMAYFLYVIGIYYNFQLYFLSTATLWHSKVMNFVINYKIGELTKNITALRFYSSFNYYSTVFSYSIAINKFICWTRTQISINYARSKRLH